MVFERSIAEILEYLRGIRIFLRYSNVDLHAYIFFGEDSWLIHHIRRHAFSSSRTFCFASTYGVNILYFTVLKLTKEFTTVDWDDLYIVNARLTNLSIFLWKILVNGLLSSKWLSINFRPILMLESLQKFVLNHMISLFLFLELLVLKFSW